MLEGKRGELGAAFPPPTPNSVVKMPLLNKAFGASAPGHPACLGSCTCRTLPCCPLHAGVASRRPSCRCCPRGVSGSRAAAWRPISGRVRAPRVPGRRRSPEALSSPTGDGVCGLGLFPAGAPPAFSVGGRLSCCRARVTAPSPSSSTLVCPLGGRGRECWRRQQRDGPLRPAGGRRGAGRSAGLPQHVAGDQHTLPDATGGPEHLPRALVGKRPPAVPEQAGGRDRGPIAAARVAEGLCRPPSLGRGVPCPCSAACSLSSQDRGTRPGPSPPPGPEDTV